VVTNMDETERREGGGPQELDTFLPALARTVRVVESLGIPHAFMGGMASAVHGRDRLTHDIDLLIRREDAGRLLDALAADGFQTERRDESWLYKATLNGVLVDIIFEAGAGPEDIELDDDMLARTSRASLGGLSFTVIGPEDLLVIKALAHKERRSRHWFDALALLASGQQLDWDYLVRRARIAPERVASLLLYARGEHLTVPDEVLAALLPVGPADQAAGAGSGGARAEAYELRRVREALAGDPRTAELEVDVTIDDGELVLTGVVATDARRAALTAVASMAVPDRRVRNLATVAPPTSEPHVEHLP
jgi:predicted nucleotidyltransferase